MRELNGYLVNRNLRILIITAAVILTASVYWVLTDTPSEIQEDNYSTLSMGYSFPLEVEDLNDYILTYSSRLSDVGFLALLEILIALPSPDIISRTRRPTLRSTSVQNTPAPFVMCLSSNLEESDKSLITEALTALFQFDPFLGGQPRFAYFPMPNPVDCDWEISLRDVQSENFGEVFFSLFVRFGPDCGGWHVVYPPNFNWTDAPKLGRETTLIC